MTDPYPPDPHSVEWRFGCEPIDWGELADGYRGRYSLAPNKIELIDGKLFWNDDVRLLMVGLLLENLGVDRVVKLGNPKAWKEAVAALPEPKGQ